MDGGHRLTLNVLTEKKTFDLKQFNWNVFLGISRIYWFTRVAL